MSSIDNYGDFELPEEKTTIEVVEDKIQLVNNSYEVFKKITENITKEKLKDGPPNTWHYNGKVQEQIYEEGLKLFEEKRNLKLDDKQIEEIIELLRKKAKDYDMTGCFLSALINSTNIKHFFIYEFTKLDSLGHKLKKNKTIITGSKINCINLGTYAQGNTINLGVVEEQGMCASEGNHIHLGKYTAFLGFEAKGGNYINQGTAKSYPGCCGKKGIFINLKNVEKPYFFKERMLIDLSEIKNALKTELEQKLAELDFLETEEPTKLIQLVNAHDWNKFYEELTEICNKIQEAYGRK